MRRLLSRLTYANIVSSLALFLVLTGGTAVALSGSNTVFSDDITDNEVRTADVRNDNLTGGGLAGGDIRNNSLTGADVRNRSLTGADTGVTMRTASPRTVACGTSDAFTPCNDLSITLPRAQRLLLVASGEWIGDGDGGNAGQCRIHVGNNVFVGGVRDFGEIGNASSAPSNPFNFSTQAVTGVLPAGGYEMGVECRETLDDVGVSDVELSAVAVGDG